MRILGYIRTSTNEQTNGLEAQRARLEQEAAARAWDMEIVEEHASGKTLARRPMLKSALARLGVHEFSGLAVVKLDRLARSVLDFASILQRASAEDWALICLDLALDTSTPNGRFTAHVLAAVAQLERDLIGQRTREALAVVKSRGVQLGHPSKVSESAIAEVLRLRGTGLGWRRVASALNVAGVLGPTGGSWNATAANRVWLRAQNPLS